MRKARSPRERATAVTFRALSFPVPTSRACLSSDASIFGSSRGDSFNGAAFFGTDALAFGEDSSLAMEERCRVRACGRGRTQGGLCVCVCLCVC